MQVAQEEEETPQPTNGGGGRLEDVKKDKLPQSNDGLEDVKNGGTLDNEVNPKGARCF